MTNTGKDVGKRNTNSVGGNINYCSHCENKYGIKKKKLKIDLPENSAVPFGHVFERG
jgi:hypothetical protein